jgi:serine/threonine-protein kinase
MRYRMIERIGIGGMAEVFRATAFGAHGFERTFVIKRILPRLAATPEFLRMFVDEAKISARLNHPNIVQVFAFAEEDGMPLLVMEHVDGRDLGEIMQRLASRGAAMPPAVAAEVARQCCAALDYAHRLTAPDGTSLGIIHRDVTPSNIMVSFEGTVKLLDFGIARAVQEVRTSQTAVGTMKGKLGYVAPEQIATGNIDQRADLFSLGAVLHEALTGRRLFAGDNDLATLKNLTEMIVQPPSKVMPAVGRSLDRTVMRALRRDPEERFASAAQMAAELGAYLQRTRTAGTAVRAFMDELYRDERRPGGRGVVDTSQGTIVLDDPDMVAPVGGERASARARIGATAAAPAADGGRGPPGQLGADGRAADLARAVRQPPARADRGAGGRGGGGADRTRGRFAPAARRRPHRRRSGQRRRGRPRADHPRFGAAGRAGGARGGRRGHRRDADGAGAGARARPRRGVGPQAGLRSDAVQAHPQPEPRRHGHAAPGGQADQDRRPGLRHPLIRAATAL